MSNMCLIGSSGFDIYVARNSVDTFADGTAVKMVGEETYRLVRDLVDDYVVVDTDAACAAIKDVFQDTRSILEPSGALAIAGAKAYVERAALTKKPLQNQTLVAVASTWGGESLLAPQQNGARLQVRGGVRGDRGCVRRVERPAG